MAVLSYGTNVSIDAARVVSGILATLRIPNLDAAKITTSRFVQARMPAGAVNLALVGQGAGADPAFAPLVNSGSYAGDSSVNKAIAHGLGVTPSLVVIFDSGSSFFYQHFIKSGVAQVYYHRHDVAGAGGIGVTAPDATNFYVGNAGNYFQSANAGFTYCWMAFK